MVTKKFIPFTHDDLELKNQLVEYARQLAATDNAESQLACAVIYASFAEYIAKHVLETLRHIMYENTYNTFAGILFVDDRNQVNRKGKHKPMMMGDVIIRLEKYEFPDKSGIVAALKSITTSRNNLLHNFAISDQKGLERLDHDVAVIKDETEDLFRRVNTVYAGLQKILDPVIGDDSGQPDVHTSKGDPSPSKSKPAKTLRTKKT